MGETSPFFTIITTVYNAGSHLESCINKVQQQQFSNFEHLIIDGKSADNTLQILEERGRLFPNIRHISEPDKGIYDAMNKGIKLAKGRWIYFLGSDDFFYSGDVLLEAASFIKQNEQTQLIYGDVWFEGLNRFYDGEFTISKILKYNICHQSIFYRKDIFDSMGEYDQNYKLHADYLFNLRCWLGGRIMHKYINKTIAHYTSGGVSSVQPDLKMLSDYPGIITDITATGQWSSFQKISIFSIIFRKIIMRYPVKVFLQNLFRQDKSLVVKLLAVVWMPFRQLYEKLKS